MEGNMYEDLQEGEKGAYLSLIAYLILSAAKLIVGILAGSQALVADGLNNISDIFTSVTVLIGLRIARKPPDKNHPYGHMRAETIAALIASFFMVVVGIDVLRQAIPKIFNVQKESPDLIAGWVALAAALIIYGVYRFNLHLGRKIQNQALLAAAYDNRSDALVSVGTFIGVLGSYFGLYWLDPFTATVIGIIILKTAWEIFIEAVHSLSDGFEESRLLEYQKKVKETPGVREVLDVKARSLGNRVILDITVSVDPLLSTLESHEIANKIERKLMKESMVIEIHTHIEPDVREDEGGRKR